MTEPTIENTAIKPRGTDKHIWGIYIALVIISIVELYSASSHEVTPANVFAPVIRHVGFLIIGLFIMLALQKIHYKKFYRASFVFAILSALLMVYTLIFGDYINGARRSFNVLFFSVQPAEMVKLSAALIVAAILCKEQMKGVNDVTTRGVVSVTIAVLIGGGLLFTQGLSNTLLLMIISSAMLIVGGASWRKILYVFGVFIIMGLLGLTVKYVVATYAKSNDKQVVAASEIVPGTNIAVADDLGGGSAEDDRVFTWIERLVRFQGSEKYNEPINDKNQQEQYSYIAQAHGGVFGVFPGNSRETARLPLAFSDYIYAIIIEEMGLFGGVLVLILYLWLLARAGRIANRCQTAFPAFLVIGMAVFITFQALCHMAIVSGLVPVSGQPLPLISKGGTSIIITSVALGVMLSVSRFAARKGKRSEINEELSELPEEVQAENPT